MDGVNLVSVATATAGAVLLLILYRAAKK